MDAGDDTLVDRMRGGSRDAAAALFERHWSSAWRAAYGVTGSREAAEDVCQDAFIRAFGGVAGFDGRRPFAAWLHRIVVNRAIDHLRRERRHRSLDAAIEAIAPPPGAVDDPILAGAVADLAPDRRAVVVLRYGLDYTPPEIAALLDLPVGTVHSRLARALAELRTTMEVPDAG